MIPTFGVFWSIVGALVLWSKIREEVKTSRQAGTSSGLVGTEASEQPACSEGEARLHRHVKELFRTGVRQEYSPPWLDQQRIDVAVPRRKLAFEYHGEQHYDVDGYWNKTEDDLRKQRERDQRKRRRLEQEGWTLIEVPYCDREQLSSAYLKAHLRKAGVELTVGQESPSAQREVTLEDSKPGKQDNDTISPIEERVLKMHKGGKSRRDIAMELISKGEKFSSTKELLARVLPKDDEEEQ